VSLSRLRGVTQWVTSFSLFMPGTVSLVLIPEKPPLKNLFFIDRYHILIVWKSVPFHLIANFYPAGDQTRSPGRTTEGKLQYNQLDQSLRPFYGASEQNRVYNQDFPSFNYQNKTNSKTKNI
jgi:hypothetical protein